ncbi:MAG: type II toxin-antitoxin system VapC family toxin [Gemmatimonadales bacterium]
MKTAVDSSVLLDVLGADPSFGSRSREALRAAYDAGALVACDVVWAEVRAHFPSDAEFGEALGLLGIMFDPVSAKAAADAGQRWAASRRAAGRRDRVVADFLIGSHAALQAEALVTRDRGFFRQAFRDLRVIDPTAH